MRAIINDGYTRTSIFRAVPNQLPALRFKWRPATTLEKSQYIDYIGDTSSADEARKMMECLVKHLCSLEEAPNEKDKWSTIEPTQENLLMLLPPLSRRLVQVVIWGDQAPDLDDQPRLESSKSATSLDEHLSKNSNRDSA